MNEISDETKRKLERLLDFINKLPPPLDAFAFGYSHGCHLEAQLSDDHIPAFEAGFMFARLSLDLVSTHAGLSDEQTMAGIEELFKLDEL